MTTTTEPGWTDIYGYTFPAGDNPGDPCLADGSTLYTILSCDPNSGYTISEFCGSWPDHPACPAPTTTTTVVEVGTPPTLPATGMSPVSAGLLAWAPILVGIGLMMACSRRRRR